MNWLAPVLNTISPYWILVAIILFLLYLINKREKRIDELIEVNKVQNDSIKDLATEIKLIWKK